MKVNGKHPVLICFVSQARVINFSCPSLSLARKVQCPSSSIAVCAMDNHREQLHVAVDYGTAVVSVAAWICKAGERPSWVCDIPLTHGNTSKRTAPQIIAWHDGKLCWGQELRDAVENRSVPEEKVIHRAKLFVYEQYRHTSWGNRIREQLEEAVMLDYQLIGLHLKAMIALVRPWLYNNTPEGLSLSLSDLGSMKTELLLLVPACWSSSGTGTMTAAAKVAGVDRCQIVTELRVSMYSVNKDNFRRITVSSSTSQDAFV